MKVDESTAGGIEGVWEVRTCGWCCVGGVRGPAEFFWGGLREITPGGASEWRCHRAGAVPGQKPGLPAPLTTTTQKKSKSMRLPGAQCRAKPGGSGSQAQRRHQITNRGGANSHFRLTGQEGKEVQVEGYF